MSTVTRLAAAALLASSAAPGQAPETSAGNADAGQPDAGALLTAREKVAAQASEQAKKDVDVAGIHLQVARLYLAGLYGLTGAPSTWDREHGVALFNQAQTALTDADRQIAELQGLAAPATRSRAPAPSSRGPRSSSARCRYPCAPVAARTRPARASSGRSTNPSTRPGTS